MQRFLATTIAAILIATSSQTVRAADDYLNISGIYPHLTAHNQVPTEIGSTKHGEAGIGAVVPWAGKLWYLTYPQHQTSGSNDKLFMVDENMEMTVRPESNGGTHANRMIHKPSNQLLIGYYVIDAEGNVRTFDPEKLVGRMTATMQHLKDPTNMAYYFDMEGAIYETDINTLDVTKLFEKPVPGWHGKGAYTAQGRVVMANNGENKVHDLGLLRVGGEAKNIDEAGVLAEWDGDQTFKIIERKQFTDVTGPDGIAPDGASLDKPLWSMGWDRRSVTLKLLDGGKWYTFRMPKASHTFDHRHGFYTEWPRIREIIPGDDPMLMMVMHAGMYDFPATFSSKNTAGIRPITTHLRYIPDFCSWNGQIVIAADDSSMMGNKMCGQAQSNLWFGTLDQLGRFGPLFGTGGPWQGDDVKAGVPSDPYLFAGYDQKTLHLKAKPGDQFVLQIDTKGDGNWTQLAKVEIGPSGYSSVQLDDSEVAQWIRLVPEQDSIASAYFHYLTPREDRAQEQAEFDSLADIRESGPVAGGVIRPAGHNRSLQWLHKQQYHGESQYIEVELDPEQKGQFAFTVAEPDSEADRSKEVSKVAHRSKRGFEVDDASVIVTRKDGQRFRLPKGPSEFDKARLRDLREVQSERWLANLHGTFYEMPRWTNNHSPNFQRIKPVSSHTKRITDFCTWRGLLVMAGTRLDATPDDGHLFTDDENHGLWMGALDDLWKLGKPVGIGGPWMNTKVKPGVASDPYLMTGYDNKQIAISHDADKPVTMTIEIDFDHTGFVEYQKITVPAGETVTFDFPAGFNAHWLRVTADQACRATAQCVYK